MKSLTGQQRAAILRAVSEAREPPTLVQLESYTGPGQTDPQIFLQATTAEVRPFSVVPSIIEPPENPAYPNRLRSHLASIFDMFGISVPTPQQIEGLDKIFSHHNPIRYFTSFDDLKDVLKGSCLEKIAQGLLIRHPTWRTNARVYDCGRLLRTKDFWAGPLHFGDPCITLGDYYLF